MGFGKGDRMKRRLIAIISILSICISMSGCMWEKNEQKPELVRGEPPVYEDGLIHVGMIQTGKESDWRDANTNDYLDTFVEEKGYELIYIDGNSSAERQVKAMYDLIQQNVDYIIVQPIVESGWKDAMIAAKQAGIPVIVADRQMNVPEELYVSWIGSNFHEEGLKAVAWLDEYLRSQGREKEQIDIILLEGTPGATATLGRSNGIIEGLEQHENWEIVDRGFANFTQGEGQTYMEQLLESERVKEFDVIIAENDNMIFGAMKALEKKGISYGPDGDVIMLSFDALGEAFDKMIAGQLHATIECNPLLAGNVEKVILDLEAGRTVEKMYYTEESVFDYLNAEEFIDTRKY